tara:strand:- start:117 stop:1841 length:1725 start_codon:yes stop_codon:yes gene_type:complete
MICYKTKYFKYKEKYLNLKQKGGNKQKIILPIKFDECIVQNYEEINPDEYNIYLGNKSDIKNKIFLSEEIDNKKFNKIKKEIEIYNCSSKKESKIIIKNTDINIKSFEDYINSLDSISGINLFGIIKINGSIIVFLGDNHAVHDSYSHSEDGNYTKLCKAFPNKKKLPTLGAWDLIKKPKHNPPDIFITDLFNYIYSQKLSANFYLEMPKNTLSDAFASSGIYETPLQYELSLIKSFIKLCKDNLNYDKEFVCDKKYLYNYTDFRWDYNVGSFLKVVQFYIQEEYGDTLYNYYKGYFVNILGLGYGNFVKFLDKFKNIDFYKIHCFYIFCFGINPDYITNTNPTNIFTYLKTKYTIYYNSKDDLDINEFFNTYIYDDLNITNENFTLNKIIFEIPKYSETQGQKWKAKTKIKYDKKNITTTRHAKQLIKVEEKQHVNLQNYLYDYIYYSVDFTQTDDFDNIEMIFIDFYSLCRLLYYLGFNNNKIENNIKYKNSINIIYGGEATDCSLLDIATYGICDGYTRGHNSSLIYYFRKYYFKELDKTKNILSNSNEDYLRKYFIPMPDIMDCVYLNNI